MYSCGGPSYGEKFFSERIDSYPPISLTHICTQELSENGLAIISATKDCDSAEDRVIETNSEATVRGLIPGNSCLLYDAHLNPEII